MRGGERTERSRPFILCFRVPCWREPMATDDTDQARDESTDDSATDDAATGNSAARRTQRGAARRSVTPSRYEGKRRPSGGTRRPERSPRPSRSTSPGRSRDPSRRERESTHRDPPREASRPRRSENRRRSEPTEVLRYGGPRDPSESDGDENATPTSGGTSLGERGARTPTRFLAGQERAAISPRTTLTSPQSSASVRAVLRVARSMNSSGSSSISPACTPQRWA